MIYNEFGVKRYVNSFIAGIFILCVYLLSQQIQIDTPKKYSNKL